MERSCFKSIKSPFAHEEESCFIFSMVGNWKGLVKIRVHLCKIAHVTLLTNFKRQNRCMSQDSFKMIFGTNSLAWAPMLGSHGISQITLILIFGIFNCSQCLTLPWNSLRNEHLVHEDALTWRKTRITYGCTISVSFDPMINSRMSNYFLNNRGFWRMNIHFHCHCCKRMMSSMLMCSQNWVKILQ